MATKYTEAFTIWLAENLVGIDTKEIACSRVQRSCSTQGWKGVGDIRTGVEEDLKH